MKDLVSNQIDEQRYRVLIDHAPEPIFIFDTTTFKFVDFNKNAVNFFKIPKKDLYSLGPLDLSPDTIDGVNVVDMATNYIEQALNGGNPVFDWIHLDSNNQEIPCEIRLVRFPPYDKQLIRASVIDRTEHKKLEVTLREREERLNLALNATNLGSFDMFPMENKLIWDDRMHELFGLPLKSSEDPNIYFFSVLHPEDSNRVQQSFFTLMDSKSTQTVFDDEYRIIRDGEVCHISTNGLLFRNEKGEVLRSIGTCLDVTEARTREAQLKSITAKLNDSHKISKMGACDVNLVTDTVWWSEGMWQILEVEPDSESPSITKFISFVHPEDQAAVSQNIKRCLEDGIPQKNEYRIKLPSGKIKNILTFIEPVRDNSGKTIGLTGTSQDITESKIVEIKLRESEERFSKSFYDNVTPMLIYDMKTGKRIDMNQSCVELFGYPKAEYLSGNLYNGNMWVDPKMKNLAIEMFKRDKLLHDFSADFITQSGKIISLILNSKTLDIGEGNLGITSFTDVTERNQINAKLKESEELFSKSFYNNINPMAIFDIKTGARINVNDSFVKLFKYSREELLNGSLFINNWWVDPVAHKEIIDKLKRDKFLHNEPADFINAEGELMSLILNVISLDIGEGNMCISTIFDVTESKKIEEALHKSEQQYRTLVENSHDLIWKLDLDGNFTFVNSVVKNVYGYEPEEMIGSNLTKIVSPDSSDDVIQLFQDLITEGKDVLQFESKTLNKQGELVIIDSRAAAHKDENGNIINIMGTSQNITKRKKAEEALRESEDLFHSVFAQQVQFMGILSPEGITLEISDLPMEAQGIMHEDYVGKYFWELPPLKNLPEWQKVVKEQVLKSVSMQGPLLTEDVYQTADGQTRYADAAYSAIRDADNNVRFILVQANDITERKLAEEELKKTQIELSTITERFQLSTEAAKVGIWDCHLETGQIIWDDVMYQLHGFTNEQKPVSHDFWQACFHPDDAERVVSEREMALEGKKDFNIEYKILWPDNSIRYIKANATVQRNADGSAERMIGTNWDITEEKEAEKQKIKSRQLEIKNQELEQFAYVASHDLKEPLRTVKGFAELLKNRYSGQLDADANKYLAFISQAASRMDGVIKALLDYSRIGRNKKLVTVNCETVIKNLLKDLSAQISETNTEFEIGHLPLIIGYQTEIRMLFQNLISNAIKFRKLNESPKIRINAKKKNSLWEFCIADNGIGIDPQFKEKIFTIFQRLHTRDKYEGTGIGLAHCHKIIELHEGEIWVESEPSVGSSFHFTIPQL